MLRAIITSVAFTFPAVAGAQQADLLDALQIDRVMAVMAAEGMKDGEMLRETLLPETPVARWNTALGHIYDVTTMGQSFEARFMAELGTSGETVAPMLEFFGSDLGQKIVTAELDARQALLDDAAEDQARLTVEEMRMASDPRFAQLQAFAEANDLIEMNVAGALNASYAFSQGLQAAGGLDVDMTEQDLLREAWAQEPVIRSETETWLYPYLVTAYAGLTAEELDAYTAFSRSGEGRILNAALFAGFNDMFRAISFDLGRLTGLQINGRDI